MQPPNLSSEPECDLYERTREWLKNHRDFLDDHGLHLTQLLQKTRLFKNYDPEAEIIHLLLITDEGGPMSFFHRILC